MRHVERGVVEWMESHEMESHEYDSVHQMQGCMSQIRCPDPSAFERAQYMRAVKDFAYIQSTSAQPLKR